MLKNCWEMLNCERQKHGKKTAEFGECIASMQQLGHSCWAVAGTLCGGTVQGDATEKRRSCMSCDVFKVYHRTTGPEGKKIREFYPDEEKKFNDLLLERMNAKYR